MSTVKKTDKDIIINTLKISIFGLFAFFVFGFVNTPKAEAGFFDDLVDFLDPTQHIGNILDGNLEKNLPPLPPDILGGAIISSFDDNSSNSTNSVGTASQAQNPTVSIFANPTYVSYNGTSTISWNSNNATSCNASGGTNGWAGSKNTSGNFYTGNLTNSTTFYITCSNNTSSANSSVVINVYNDNNNYNYNQTPVINLYARETYLNTGSSTYINWNPTNNPTFCNGNNGNNYWSGTRSISASNFFTGQLYNTTVYTLTCGNNAGSTTESVTVNINSNNYNNQNYYQPNYQTNYSQTSVSISADRTSVAYNEGTTIRWYTSSASYCNATGGGSGWAGTRNAFSSSFNTGPLFQTTTYTISCGNYNGYGYDTKSVTVFVGNQTQTTNPSPLTATTVGATQISNTGVQLNSLITSSGNDSKNSWFEWGRTISLGNKTTITPLGSSPSTIHADTLSGLSPGTTYYFRAVTENSLWRNIGSTLSFVTNGTQQNTTARVTTNTDTTTNTGTNNTTILEGVGSEVQPAQSLLGANVIGAGSFLPGNILGWLLLIILILILILLSRRTYGEFVEKKAPKQDTHTQEHGH